MALLYSSSRSSGFADSTILSILASVKTELNPTKSPFEMKNARSCIERNKRIPVSPSDVTEPTPQLSWIDMAKSFAAVMIAAS
eukprot:CAMPEP_0171301132 /NCGR_PEP_ID=MMETSP0816-20121228/10221_1 /TAXON_ID=420281 /ORGANISM="Proboscia inermis, Strain CCAP1064/1" /LENGTH=82 /DNA_ID=CAMNT_0011778397 /DNA_START=15 /DNA_END=260 /DNA_ORIENTATION=+